MSLIFIAGTVINFVWAGELYLYLKKCAHQDKRIFTLRQAQRKIWSKLRDKYPVVTLEEFKKAQAESAVIDQKIMGGAPAKIYNN